LSLLLRAKWGKRRLFGRGMSIGWMVLMGQLFRSHRPRSCSLGSSFGCFCGLLNGASSMGMKPVETPMCTVYLGQRCQYPDRAQHHATVISWGDARPSPRPGKTAHALLHAGDGWTTWQGQVGISRMKTIVMHDCIWSCFLYPS